MLVVPSASDAEAVTPTVLPEAAFSCTVLVPEFESVGVDVSCSSTSVSVTVNCAESWLLSALVAFTVTVQEVAVS